MLNESGRVAALTGLTTQRVLERCQWTDPADELDSRPVDRNWYVEVRQPRPSQYQKPTSHDEHNEHEMQSDHEVGENAAHAVCRCSFWFSAATFVVTSGGASAYPWGFCR